MLMAWGPYRFTVPNYSVETIKRSVHPRIEGQPVIGAAPPIHRLGPANEQITLQSTFHPHHFNGNGLAQLNGVRQTVNALKPMMLTHVNGAQLNIFGTWIGVSLEDEHTIFDTRGIPSTVTATLTLMQEGGEASSARAAAMAAVGGSINFSGSVTLGGSLTISGSIGIGF